MGNTQETNKEAWRGVRNASGEDGLDVTMPDPTLLNATTRIQGYDSEGSTYRPVAVDGTGRIKVVNPITTNRLQQAIDNSRNFDLFIELNGLYVRAIANEPRFTDIMYLGTVGSPLVYFAALTYRHCLYIAAPAADGHEYYMIPSIVFTPAEYSEIIFTVSLNINALHGNTAKPTGFGFSYGYSNAYTYDTTAAWFVDYNAQTMYARNGKSKAIAAGMTLGSWCEYSIKLTLSATDITQFDYMENGEVVETMLDADMDAILHDSRFAPSIFFQSDAGDPQTLCYQWLYIAGTRR